MGGRIFAHLIIGITGKRDLEGKDDAVRTALREAFECLDQRFRNTPKILLSALAQGADMIAAEEALRHIERQRGTAAASCSWQVIAVLPFPLEIYLQDFDLPNQERLRQLCGRIQTQVLPPLYRPQHGRPLEPGAPFNWDELVRSDGNPHRTDHYEQVGLYIADKCGLLIAVMARDEQPAKIGGTARIVDYQVYATFDASRRDIVRRSPVLGRLPLDGPQPGPAWVINLAALDPAKRSQLGAIEQWEPVVPEQPLRSHEGHGAHNPIEIRKTPLTSMRYDIGRLWLATAIEVFNAKVPRFAEARWQEDVEDRAGTDTSDASFALRRLRLALSLVQQEEKRKLKRTALLLAALFVVAVVSLEVHIEFKIDTAIYVYVSLFLVILLVYGYARWRRFQQHTEDYRAVAEALRVQLVWWDAGLCGHEHRVDRTYFAGKTGLPARVRTAIRQAIDSMLLTRPSPKPCPESDRQWIKGQVDFFQKRVDKRHATLSFVEDLAWFLFISSFGMALFLAALALWRDATVGTVMHILSWLSPTGVLIAGLPALLGLFFLWSKHFPRIAFSSTIGGALAVVVFLLPVVAGCIVSLGLYEGAVQLMKLGVGAHAHSPELNPSDRAHELILLAMIGIAALAGATRYYVEKLSEEHELFSYRDALQTFARAQHELSELDGDSSAAAQARRHGILIALGKDALVENEAWIHAHRLRPLEPVV
jgi:hypothetical protein